MKQYTIYKKSAICAALAGMLFFSSCIKDYRNGETQFSNLQPVVLIPEGGLAAFGSQALNFPGSDDVDTFYFRVNYAATNVAPTDEKITLAVDNSIITAYNSSNTVQYQPFPDSVFSFTTTDVTVKAGESYSALIPVAVHPSKIDPTQNYMLPITIKGVPANATISGNFGTLYIHLIGNPVAGVYNGFGTRYNYNNPGVSYTYPGPYPTPDATIDLTPYYPRVLAADDAHTVEVPYATLGSPANLVVTLDDNLVITNVTESAALAAAVSHFFVYYANYDKATKTFHFITHYNNDPTGAAGRDRIIDETMTHQ